MDDKLIEIEKGVEVPGGSVTGFGYRSSKTLSLEMKKALDSMEVGDSVVVAGDCFIAARGMLVRKKKATRSLKQEDGTHRLWRVS